MLGIALIVTDTTIVHVIVPSLIKDLGIDLGQAQWVVAPTAAGRPRSGTPRSPREAAETAAALARHARQGHDLRLAVLSWFTVADLADVLDREFPSRRIRPVLAALEHVTAASPWYRLFTQARR